MKFVVKLLLCFCFLWCASMAHAQGACPVGLLSGLTGNNCYFSSSSIGLDSYSGTTETVGGTCGAHTCGPWKYLPGMPNCTSVCASVTPGGAQNFVVEGGSIYHLYNPSPSSGVYIGAGGINWQYAGTSTNCNLDATVGTVVKTSCLGIVVDTAWFSGVSFVRPMFSWDNPLSTSMVTGCAFDSIYPNEFVVRGSYNIFDGLDFQGICSWNQGGDYLVAFNLPIEVSRSYLHGWTIPLAVTGTLSTSVNTLTGTGFNTNWSNGPKIVVDNASYTSLSCSSSTACTVGGASGTVNTSGTAVTWVSGTQFSTHWTVTLTINSVTYNSYTVNSPTSITLATSAGIHSGTSFSVTGPGTETSVSYTVVSNIAGSGLIGSQNNTGFFMEDHDVIDGSDSTYGGDALVTSTPTQGIGTGNGLGLCTDVEFSVVRWIANFCVESSTGSAGSGVHSYHDNLFSNNYNVVNSAPDWVALASPVFSYPIAPTVNNSGTQEYAVLVPGTNGASEPNWQTTCPNAAQLCVDGTTTWVNLTGDYHGNIIEMKSGGAGNSNGNVLFYNNNAFLSPNGVAFDLIPCSGCFVYAVNNVFGYGMRGAGCFGPNGNGAASGITAYIYNNTFVSPCNIPAGTPITTNLQNNHLIGYNASNCTGTCTTGYTNVIWAGGTLGTNTNNVWMNSSTATSQGFVQGNNYAETAITNTTYQFGNNNSSLVSTFTPTDSAYGSGTTNGCTLVSMWGGEGVTCPTLIPHARGTTYDAGAYAFFPSSPTIPSYLFSQGFNKTSSPWCPIDGNSVNAQIYGYRIWDDGEKLSQIFTSSLTPTWTSLDTTINSRATSGGCPGTPMKIIYTFGDTPQWASNCSGCADPSTSLPGPVGSGFGGGTQCSGTSDYSCLPWSDVATDGTGTDANFSSMVSQIVTRYSGKITYYEAWNEQDSPNFSCYVGSPVVCGGGNPNTTANVAQLNRAVRMAWDAYNIEKCLDPASKALSPSFHVGTALNWFHYFNITSITSTALVAGTNNYPVGCPTIASQAVTGKMTYDYVNVHPRGGSSAYPATGGNWDPSNIVPAFNNTVTEIANDSLPNPTIIFGDEFGYNSATEGGTVTTNFSAYVAQSYTFCASLGFAQCYWYQWDTTTIGLSQALQGTAYDTVANWLIGATVTSTCSLTGSIYSCPFTIGGFTSIIAWDKSTYSTTSCCTTSNHSFGSAYTLYTDLTNTAHPTTGGNGTVPLSWQPVLIQQTGSVPAAPTQLQGTVTVSGSVPVIH